MLNDVEALSKGMLMLSLIHIYMYWQNRFERENPDEKLEKEILDIRKVHKDYGYRRIWGEFDKYTAFGRI